MSFSFFNRRFSFAFIKNSSLESDFPSFSANKIGFVPDNGVKDDYVKRGWEPLNLDGVLFEVNCIIGEASGNFIVEALRVAI
jgi:hypothetical protein